MLRCAVLAGTSSRYPQLPAWAAPAVYNYSQAVEIDGQVRASTVAFCKALLACHACDQAAAHAPLMQTLAAAQFFFSGVRPHPDSGP